MSPLDEAAAKWAAEHPDEAPPAPQPSADAPGSRAEPATSTPPQNEPHEEQPTDPSEHALPMEEIAGFGVALIDAGLQNFVSPRCAFKPEQRAELGDLGAKVLRKWLPSIEGAVEPEYAFAGSVALFAYLNYKSSEPTQKTSASPAGGGGGDHGGSGVSTEANVDGRSVNAQVLQ